MSWYDTDCEHQSYRTDGRNLCRIDTQVYRGADIDSDHRLVVLFKRLKLQCKIKSKPQKSFDVQLCKEEDYRREYMEGIRSLTIESNREMQRRDGRS